MRCKVIQKYLILALFLLVSSLLVSPPRADNQIHVPKHLPDKTSLTCSFFRGNAMPSLGFTVALNYRKITAGQHDDLIATL